MRSFVLGPILMVMAMIAMQPLGAEAQGFGVGGLGLAPPVNTFSISYFGHMAVVTDSAGRTTSSELWALEATGAGVAHRSATDADNWTRVASPLVFAGTFPTGSFVPVTFFPLAGVARATTTLGGGAHARAPNVFTRVYAVAAPTQGGPPAELYELTPTNVGTSRSAWRSLGSPPGGSLDNSPAIAAMGSQDRTERWVALRTADSHIWTCNYSGAGACTWTDINDAAHDPIHAHLAVGDVAIVDLPLGPHIFAVTDGGFAEMFEFVTRRWVTLPLPAPGLTVDVGGLAAVAFTLRQRAQRHTIHVAATAGGHLFVATTRNFGVSWTWNQLVPADEIEPSIGYNTFGPGSIDIVARQPTPGSVDLAVFVGATGDSGDELIPCRLPRTIGLPLAAPLRCLPVGGVPFSVPLVPPIARMPQPSDLSPTHDRLVFSVVGLLLPTLVPSTQPSRMMAFATGLAANNSPKQFISGVSYVYAFDSEADGCDQPIWQNLLAPHTDVAVLPGSTVMELSGAEFFGRVAFVDNAANFWQSTDDGNSWFGGNTLSSLAGAPFPIIDPSGQSPPTGVATQDLNLGYDGAGNLYVTVTGADGADPPTDGFVLITRVPSGGSASTARVIPGSFQMPDTLDRPWLAVLRDRPNFVLVNWNPADASGLGRIAYCNAGPSGDCTSRDATWCPPRPVSGTQSGFVLPSSCGSPDDTAIGGCPIAQAATADLTRAGDGNVWIALAGDTGCRPGPGTTFFGLRRITNLPDLGANCTEPRLSLPECIYFTAVSTNDPRLIQFHSTGTPRVGNPALFGHRWTNELVGSPDTGDILFTLTTASRIPSGTPCASPTDICRVDVALLRRDAATGHWCGPSGVCAPGPNVIVGPDFIANADRPDQQEDHTLPVLAFYAFGQASAYWLDFRSSPLTDDAYEYRRRLMRYAAGQVDVLLRSDESAAWPQSVVPVPYDTARSYGDVDFMASAGLHGHSMHGFPPFGSMPAPHFAANTVLSSPRDPPR